MINGVRSKKAKNKASLFQPMAIVELVVSNSHKSNLQRVSEVSVQHPYSNIPYNIVKSSIAIFINEVLYRSLKEQHSDEDLYEYIKSSLLILDIQQENCSNFHVCFMMQLTRFLGFYPQGNYSGTTPFFDLQEGKFISSMPTHANYMPSQISVFLEQLIRSNYSDVHLLILSRVQRKELLRNMILFYQLHISSFGEIRSLEVLEEVIA
jgi:DNA repair protein RecO (recombination protein O)